MSLLVFVGFFTITATRFETKISYKHAKLFIDDPNEF